MYPIRFIEDYYDNVYFIFFFQILFEQKLDLDKLYLIEAHVHQSI